MSLEIVQIPGDVKAQDRQLRRYAFEAMEFLHRVMNDQACPLELRIEAARILATKATLPECD